VKRVIISILLCQITFCLSAQDTIPASATQIKLALLAAPDDGKEEATVYGYSPGKELILLRKGKNELICLSDDPAQPGLSVACYHRDLEAFMKRGRDLRKAGKSPKEIFDIREQEAKEGRLIMPKVPASLYVYSAQAKDYDHMKGEVTNGYLRSAIYIPYATAESTGLPLKPQAPGMPWIMDPGTHGAHIMINPKK
jgi:hypothetical protein